MAALVTGALGHIGRWVTLQLLELGEDVVAVDLPTLSAETMPSDLRPFLSSGRLRYEAASVLDGDAIRRVLAAAGIEGVIHIAGISGVPVFGQTPRQSLELNLMGLINVLDAARECGVGRFIYVSSGAVYGEREGILREDHAAEPADLYSVVKLAGEQIALSFGETYDLDVTCARVFFVYGPGRHPSQMWIPAEAIFGPLHGIGGIELESGADQAIDFTHVFDAAQGIVLLYRATDLPEDAYNISSGTAVTVGDAVRIVSDVLGADSGIRVGPGKSRKRGSPLDITRAQRDVGYRPRFANLRDGVTHYYQWLREHDQEIEWTSRRRSPTGKSD